MAGELGEEFANVRQLRRNWALPISNILFFCLGMVAWKYGDLHDNGWAPLGAFAMWLGGWIAALTLWRNAFRHERAAKLVASRSAFELNDAVILAEDIVEAKVFPQAIRQARDVVELKVRTGNKWWQKKTLWLGLMPKDAARFVNLIGTGGGERRASFALAIPFARRFLAVFVVLGVPWMTKTIVEARNVDLGGTFLGALILGGFVVAPFCAVIAAIFGVLRGRLVIGAEGFTTHWYGHRSYRSFDTVKQITVEGRRGTGGKIVDTIVEGTDGRKRKRLLAHDRPDTEAQRGAESRALAHTMQAAFDRWLRMPDVAKASAQLEPTGRSGKEWLAGIDRLVRGPANYRVAPIAAETLAAVTRASDVSSGARVGAAAALLRLEGGAHRATVRIAAEACAEPVTRQALLELVDANEDETKLQAALDRVR